MLCTAFTGTRHGAILNSTACFKHATEVGPDDLMPCVVFLLTPSGVPNYQPCSVSTTAVYLESQGCHSTDPVNVTSCNGACGTFTL